MFDVDISTHRQERVNSRSPYWILVNFRVGKGYLMVTVGQQG